MGKIRWKRMLALLVVILAAGCGAKGQGAEPTPTQVLTPTPEAAQSAFASAEEPWEKPTAGLKEDLPEKGTAGRAEYNAMNRMISYHTEINRQSLFCIDADTGVIYFVNQNKDCYIYLLKDGIAELAVAMPARELYAYGGSLYFMIESYGKYQMGDVRNGDIYCYTPKDGTIELVYAAGKRAEEENATNCQLWVDKNGIYFCYYKPEETEIDGSILTLNYVDSYYLPFGAEEPVKDPLQTAADLGWRDYFFGLFALPGQSLDSPPPLGLMSRTEGSKDYKELSVGRPWDFCVMGDELYYIYGLSDATSIFVLDLLTDRKEEYSIWEELKKIYYVATGAETSPKDFILSDKELTEQLNGEMADKVMVKCFTATEQYFWAVVQNSNLVRIDRKTKETTYFKMRNGIDALYTDGEQLYGMCAPTVNGVGMMARILTDEVRYDEFFGMEYLAVEYLTD